MLTKDFILIRRLEKLECEKAGVVEGALVILFRNAHRVLRDQYCSLQDQSIIGCHDVKLDVTQTGGFSAESIVEARPLGFP